MSVFVCFLQVSIATVCVRRDAGDPTAPTPAPVRTEGPAPQMTAPVCVLPATVAQTADEVKKYHIQTHIHISAHTYCTYANTATVQWRRKKTNLQQHNWKIIELYAMQCAEESKYCLQRIVRLFYQPHIHASILKIHIMIVLLSDKTEGLCDLTCLI